MASEETMNSVKLKFWEYTPLKDFDELKDCLKNYTTTEKSTKEINHL